MTKPNDPSACELAADEYIKSLDGDRYYLYLATKKDSFKAGWSECEKHLGQRIQDAEKDYADMRKFQAKFIQSDHKVKELESLVDVLKNGTSYRILELEDQLKECTEAKRVWMVACINARDVENPKLRSKLEAAIKGLELGTEHPETGGVFWRENLIAQLTKESK